MVQVIKSKDYLLLRATEKQVLEVLLTYMAKGERHGDIDTLQEKEERGNGGLSGSFKEQVGMVTNLNKIKAMGFMTAGLDLIKGKKLRSLLYDLCLKFINNICVCEREEKIFGEK